WTVAHRYWQIMGANSIASPIKIRFYFSNQDVTDIAASVDDFGFYVDEPEDVYMFTLGKGNGLYPLSTSTGGGLAQFALYDMVPGPSPDWSAGTFNGFPYAEFDVPTADIGGGLGFLIFLPEAPVSVMGNISKENGAPVSQVEVEAATASMSMSDTFGNYGCPNLPVGGSYEITPKKLTNPAESITTVDLIAMSRHLLGIEPLESPYRLIAADADADGTITLADQNQIRKVLLGSLPVFPGNKSWRFVPESYVFPDPDNPFSPPFPETILVNNLTDSLENQDFIGIKTGDVADKATGNPPPPVRTAFALPSQFSTCNPGDTVSLPLTVQGFQNVAGFQFTLEWNLDVLQYLGAANYNLTGFNQQNIGTLYDEEGKLTFAWFNPNLGGSTLANGSAICQLRFIAVGDFSQSTALQFTGSLTPALVVHQNLVENVPGFQAGNFLLENNSTLAATAAVQPAGCEGVANGSIDLSISGATLPVSYLWSNGATTQDLTNLPGGTFWVTISDAS
ncbi:MAG: cohesin domain-containing protein, partial [Bacteroidota bacterium]